jgi:hypothetical protein
MRTPLQVPAIYCDIVGEDAWDARWDASNPYRKIVDLTLHWGKLPLEQQQQQLKKLGIIIHYLDKFNHTWSLHTPKAQGQTASQSEPLERAALLPGLSPGYIWLFSHTAVF